MTSLNSARTPGATDPPGHRPAGRPPDRNATHAVDPRGADPVIDAAVQAIRRSLSAEDAGGAAQAARNAAAHANGALGLATSARVHNLCGAAWMVSGELSDAAGALLRARDAAELAGEPALRARADVNLGVLAGLCGQFSAAREACAAGHAALSSLRLPEAAAQLNNIAWLWMFEADAAMALADGTAAAAALLKAQEVAEQFLRDAAALRRQGRMTAAPVAESDVVASLMLRLGRVGEARARFEATVAGGPVGLATRPTLRVVAAEIALGESRPALALELLQSPAADGLPWTRTGMWLQLRRADALMRLHQALAQPEEAARCAFEHSRLLRQRGHQQLRALPLLMGAPLVSRASRDESLTYMVHDVRAPLGRIIATLRDTSQPGRADAAIAVAERTLTRIDALMQNLRLDAIAGMQRQPLDLGGVADDACEELALRAADAGLRLEREIDFDAGLLVLGWRDALLRASVNLLDNAIAATPAGGCVRMCCHRENASVILSVSDQGPGMPAAACAVLRASAASAAESSPLLTAGFGLRYVARVSRMHEARLEVTSSGAGSRVELALSACT